VRPVSSLRCNRLAPASGSASSKCVTAGGRPLAAAADRHAAHVVAIAPDRRVDRAAARGRAAAHERDVLALDLPRAHLLPERRIRLVAAGEHEQTRRVAVEPVDHARALLVVTAAQAETAQCGHQRGPDHSGSRMRDHPGRLVGHDHVIVDQGERDLEPHAGLGPGRSALHVVFELDQLASRQPQRLVRPLAVDAHGPALDQALGGRA